ncbi:unnamed protein product, partial [Scytosiphon promiscuus]
VSCITNHWRLASTVGSVVFLSIAVATTAATTAAAEGGYASRQHDSGRLENDSLTAAKGLNGDEPGTESFGGHANPASAVLQPEDLPAHQALQRADELHVLGELEAAASEYRQAIKLKSDLSPAWLNLGVTLARLDREDDAIDAYKMLEKLPNAPGVDAAGAYCNHGQLIQMRAGVDSVLIEEGISLFHRGLESLPDHAGCMYNMGLAIGKLGRYSEARNLFLQALAVNPSLGEAHLDLGNIAFRWDNLTEAISRYERAFESPDADERLRRVSSFMLGQVYNHGMGNRRKALEYYKLAYSVGSFYSEALCAILQALRSLCLWEGWEYLDARIAAVIAHEVSSGKAPASQNAYETRLTGELKSSQHLGLARLVSQEYDRVECLLLPDEIGELTFRRTNHQHNTNEDIDEQVTDFNGWLRAQGIETTTSKGLAPRRGGQATSYKDRATRGLVVVYWSYDYREHAMGHLTQRLFCSHQIHDRIFTVAASYGPNDGGLVRRSAEKCAGIFLDLFSAGHLDSAKAIAAERPQIFVDLAGHTTGSRLDIPALRPAPIVASYLGYPGTIGAEYTDYNIVDKTAAPPELANVGFSEKMVYLPHSYQANSYSMSHGFCPGGEGLRECQASARRGGGRLDDFLDAWGGEGPVLCNFNTIHKMEPESFTVFMNILKRLPGSVLLLLAPSRDPADGAAANLKAEAAAMGVHPDRILLDKMLTREEHIWRVSGSCDLFVDSFVYGAHTTAADALWAGLPLVTLRGYGVDDIPVGPMSSRVGASLLFALGLDELSFYSVKELEDAAVALVQSPGRLASLRKRLLSAAMNTPLFDTHIIARNLERAYEAMWEQRELGLPPAHIVVDPTQSALPPLKLGFDDRSAVVAPPRVRRAVTGVLSKGPQTAASGEAGDQSDAITAAEHMFARGVEAAAVWEETGTREGAEAALTATGRLLAGNPLSVDALHLQGVALHMLGRLTEAAVVMETAALLATSMKHRQPSLDTAMLWQNLDSTQHAKSEADGLPSVPKEASAPFRKALAVDPSQPTPLHIILKRHLSRKDRAACVADFWAYWAPMRGLGPRFHESSSGAAEGRDDQHGDFLPGVEGGSPPRFGDGWAWEVWRGGDAHAAAGIAEVAATCFVGLGRYEEAWRAWKLASDIKPANQAYPVQHALCLNEAGHQEEAHHEMERAIKALNHQWFTEEGGSKVPRVPRPRDSADGRPRPMVVAFYCSEYGNEWFPHWGPSSLDQGLGGSEEAVIYLSRELARLGFWVEVYADPIGGDVERDRGAGGEGDGVSGGVVWYPYKAYDVSRPPDIFVAWRYQASLHLAEGSGRRFLWLHDITAPLFLGVADKLDGVVCPSLFHISTIRPEAVRSLGRVASVPNGVDPSIFRDGVNSPDVFVYGSAPNRGLRAVLAMWPFIRSHVATATLEVYYGFSDTFLKWGQRNIENFGDWLAEMNHLLRQDGVLFRGMVDHRTLHDAFSRAGFVLYPTAFPETGCLSLIKAMAMGAIPITSRFPNSTLPELTGEWDMGPREALAGDLTMPEKDKPWLESWARAVVHASKMDQSERLKAQADARRQSERPGDHDGDLLPRDIGVEGVQRGLVGGVQDRRRAMKEAVRERYALGATARLWAEEMTREKRAR